MRDRVKERPLAETYIYVYKHNVNLSNGVDLTGLLWGIKEDWGSGPAGSGAEPLSLIHI